jgi:hypothetical protein
LEVGSKPAVSTSVPDHCKARIILSKSSPVRLPVCPLSPCCTASSYKKRQGKRGGRGEEEKKELDLSQNCGITTNYNGFHRSVG